MRIEEVMSGYNNAGGAPTAKRRRTRGRTSRKRRPLVLDMIELSPSGRGDDYEWLADYIDRLPAETVSERIRRSFDAGESKEELLVCKLLLELL